jgi:hypothetical protein
VAHEPHGLHSEEKTHVSAAGTPLERTRQTGRAHGSAILHAATAGQVLFSPHCCRLPRLLYAMATVSSCGILKTRTPFALWQHIAKDRAIDCRMFMAAMYPGTLLGRRGSCSTWPMLTREGAVNGYVLHLLLLPPCRDYHSLEGHYQKWSDVGYNKTESCIDLRRPSKEWERHEYDRSRPIQYRTIS